MILTIDRSLCFRTSGMLAYAAFPAPLLHSGAFFCVDKRGKKRYNDMMRNDSKGKEAES